MSDCDKILKEIAYKFDLETAVEAHLSVVIEAAQNETKSLGAER